MIKLSKNNQAFAPVVIVIGLLIIGFITTVSSLLLQNKNLALTYKTRANEEWRCPGPDCDKCGRDGWWGSGCSTSPDAPTGAAPPSNSCPCEQKESCISGKWCGNDCAYHDNNDYRCTPNQPTISAGAPSECNAPESCVGNRWCGNDLKFHDEINYKCQPQPPTPTGSRQCNAPESCVGKRWCGNDYSFHDDLNYIKNCAQKPSGTGANSYCTDGSQCTSGYCKDKYCAVRPTPTPNPVVSLASTNCEYQSFGECNNFGDCISPNQCKAVPGITNCYQCIAPGQNPATLSIKCPDIGYLKDSSGNCYYCNALDQPARKINCSDYPSSTNCEYQSFRECNNFGDCIFPDQCKAVSGLANCYQCISTSTQTNLGNCSDTGVAFDKKLNQYIECATINQPPNIITKTQYDKKMKEAENNNISKILAGSDGCGDPANNNQIFTLDNGCYRCSQSTPVKIDCPPTPTPFKNTDGSCVCENGVWDGPDCYKENPEIYRHSCVEALVTRVNEEQIQKQLTVLKEEKAKCAMRCIGTCIVTAEGYVKCVDYSSEKTTAQGQGSGGAMGDIGTTISNLVSRSQNGGYLFGKCRERVEAYDTFYECDGKYQCKSGMCLPDESFEQATAVLKEINNIKDSLKNPLDITRLIAGNINTPQVYQEFSKLLPQQLGDCDGKWVYSSTALKFECINNSEIIDQYKINSLGDQSKLGLRGELDGGCKGIFNTCNSSEYTCETRNGRPTCVLSGAAKQAIAIDLIAKKDLGNNLSVDMISALETNRTLFQGDPTFGQAITAVDFAKKSCNTGDSFYLANGACWQCLDTVTKIATQADMKFCTDKTYASVIVGSQCRASGGYCAQGTISCDGGQSDCPTEYRCCTASGTGGVGKIGSECVRVARKYRDTSQSSGCAPGLYCVEGRCQDETVLAFSEKFSQKNIGVVVLDQIINPIATSLSPAYYRSATIRAYADDQLANSMCDKLTGDDATSECEKIKSSVVSNMDGAARSQLLLRSGELNWGGSTGARASTWANAWLSNYNANDVVTVVDLEKQTEQMVRDGQLTERERSSMINSAKGNAAKNIGLAVVDAVSTAAIIAGPAAKAGTFVLSSGSKAVKALGTGLKAVGGVGKVADVASPALFVANAGYEGFKAGNVKGALTNMLPVGGMLFGMKGVGAVAGIAGNGVSRVVGHFAGTSDDVLIREAYQAASKEVADTFAKGGQNMDDPAVMKMVRDQTIDRTNVVLTEQLAQGGNKVIQDLKGKITAVVDTSSISHLAPVQVATDQVEKILAYQRFANDAKTPEEMVSRVAEELGGAGDPAILAQVRSVVDANEVLGGSWLKTDAKHIAAYTDLAKAAEGKPPLTVALAQDVLQPLVGETEAKRMVAMLQHDKSPLIYQPPTLWQNVVGAGKALVAPKAEIKPPTQVERINQLVSDITEPERAVLLALPAGLSDESIKGVVAKLRAPKIEAAILDPKAYLVKIGNTTESLKSLVGSRTEVGFVFQGSGNKLYTVIQDGGVYKRLEVESTSASGPYRFIVDTTQVPKTGTFESLVADATTFRTKTKAPLPLAKAADLKPISINIDPNAILARAAGGDLTGLVADLGIQQADVASVAKLAKGKAEAQKIIDGLSPSAQRDFKDFELHRRLVAGGMSAVDAGSVVRKLLDENNPAVHATALYTPPVTQGFFAKIRDIFTPPKKQTPATAVAPPADEVVPLGQRAAAQPAAVVAPPAGNGAGDVPAAVQPAVPGAAKPVVPAGQPARSPLVGGGGDAADSRTMIFAPLDQRTGGVSAKGRQPIKMPASGEVIVGRDRSAKVRITDDKGVSGQQASLTTVNGKHTITDLQSTNHTYVNGRQLTGDPHELVKDDVVTMGNGYYQYDGQRLVPMDYDDALLTIQTRTDYSDTRLRPVQAKSGQVLPPDAVRVIRPEEVPIWYQERIKASQPQPSRGVHPVTDPQTGRVIGITKFDGRGYTDITGRALKELNLTNTNDLRVHTSANGTIYAVNLQTGETAILQHSNRFLAGLRDAGDVKVDLRHQYPQNYQKALPVKKKVKPVTTTSGARGDVSRYTFDGSEPIAIGRDGKSTIVYSDQRISRQHAVVSKSGDQYIITNRSPNGTFVNGVVVAQPRVLTHGDVVRVGENELIAVIHPDGKIRLDKPPRSVRGAVGEVANRTNSHPYQDAVARGDGVLVNNRYYRVSANADGVSTTNVYENGRFIVRTAKDSRAVAYNSVDLAKKHAIELLNAGESPENAIKKAIEQTHAEIVNAGAGDGTAVLSLVLTDVSSGKVYVGTVGDPITFMVDSQGVRVLNRWTDKDGNVMNLGQQMETNIVNGVIGQPRERLRVGTTQFDIPQGDFMIVSGSDQLYKMFEGELKANNRVWRNDGVINAPTISRAYSAANGDPEAFVNMIGRYNNYGDDLGIVVDSFKGVSPAARGRGGSSLGIINPAMVDGPQHLLFPNPANEAEWMFRLPWESAEQARVVRLPWQKAEQIIPAGVIGQTTVSKKIGLVQRILPAREVKVGFISDVHSDVAAFNASLQDLGIVDSAGIATGKHAIFGGDYFGKTTTGLVSVNPNPGLEILEKVITLQKESSGKIVALAGNWETRIALAMRTARQAEVDITNQTLRETLIRTANSKRFSLDEIDVAISPAHLDTVVDQLSQLRFLHQLPDGSIAQHVDTAELLRYAFKDEAEVDHLLTHRPDLAKNVKQILQGRGDKKSSISVEDLTTLKKAFNAIYWDNKTIVERVNTNATTIMRDGIIKIDDKNTGVALMALDTDMAGELVFYQQPEVAIAFRDIFDPRGQIFHGHSPVDTVRSLAIENKFDEIAPGVFRFVTDQGALVDMHNLDGRMSTGMRISRPDGQFFPVLKGIVQTNTGDAIFSEPQKLAQDITFSVRPNDVLYRAYQLFGTFLAAIF